MRNNRFPFTVRLIGFDAEQTQALAVTLVQAPSAWPAFVCLHEDSLQPPDMFIGNGTNLKALAQLAAAQPSDVRPAMVIGAGELALPFARVDSVHDGARVLAVLRELVERRADVLARVSAAAAAPVPERRRRERLDIDLTDTDQYRQMRRAPPGGAVLIVDKDGAFRDHVAKLLGAAKLSIEWTDSAAAAVRLCDETPISLVLINTSTPGIDAVRLCRSIKDLAGAARIAVVMLVGAAFAYDGALGRAAGARGMLDKPVADRHLVSVLKKLLSMPQ